MQVENCVVPKVKDKLEVEDFLGTLRVRLGISRSGYKVNPGLYCVGNPSHTSPVLVTANYKLSFDTLRSSVSGKDVWLLVIDTRGVNVWCAAGKGTFSADEIALQIKQSNLDKIVIHRELILPQFAAVGVALHDLKRKCGFKGVYGPIRAQDLSSYLERNKQADERMRSITFSVGERLVLVPVEIALTWKILLIITAASFVLSGFGPEIYSLQAALNRGLSVTGATMTGLAAGALFTPLLLPWLPGRQFWFKGATAGFFFGLIYLFQLMKGAQVLEQVGILLWITATSSYLAMNFTGATPFTSLSGVEQEMRKGLPIQFVGVVLGTVLWLVTPFLR